LEESFFHCLSAKYTKRASLEHDLFRLADHVLVRQLIRREDID
jgi:hypothetical protein